ncbi:MAG TPA: hypothetical protein VJO53_08765 [Candidatus Acidoferrales bacterium]|nr:hypothetical protein [Candidatus Acidoferrales bacterium]
MIATLIGMVSLAALVQVFVSYSRSALASAKEIQLSSRVLEVAGIESESLTAEDFDRFLQLVRLCPEHDADRTEIRAIGSYYGLLSTIGRLSRKRMPRAAAWADDERRSCSHFAAVVLDRCISYSRGRFARQASDSF